jgi:hypothetical protein
MPEEGFRLPKSSYDELVKIIQAYGSSGPNSTLEDIATTAVIDTTTVSRNNAFLVSAGIVEGGKVKGITEKGKRLSRALLYNVPEDIAQGWVDIITSTEFLQKMVTAVNIRGGMEEAALQAHIAYSAGEPKGAHSMAGAGAVVEILKVAAAIKEEDGKLVAVAGPVSGISLVFGRPVPKETGKTQREEGASKSERREKPEALSIAVNIQIQCAPGDLSDLSPRLRALIRQLREGSAANRDE